MAKKYELILETAIKTTEDVDRFNHSPKQFLFDHFRLEGSFDDYVWIKGKRKDKPFYACVEKKQ